MSNNIWQDQKQDWGGKNPHHTKKDSVRLSLELSQVFQNAMDQI